MSKEPGLKQAILPVFLAFVDGNLWGFSYGCFTHDIPVIGVLSALVSAQLLVLVYVMFRDRFWSYI